MRPLLINLARRGKSLWGLACFVRFINGGRFCGTFEVWIRFLEGVEGAPVRGGLRLVRKRS